MAYIIQDVKTGTVLLSQKLQHAVNFANTHLAEAQRERITVQSLYEAIDTDSNRVDGCHKMRYRITRSDLQAARLEFERARQRQGVRAAIILTASPSCYHIVPIGASLAEE